MENISKEFTYNLADDIYHQTNDLKKTATLTYNGPAKKYVVVDSSTNKLTGATITQEQYETFNETNDEMYAVEVDCDKDTLICSILNVAINPEDVPNISEAVPGSNIPYVRDEPVLPDHTYEATEITYNKGSQSFDKPFPWKKPYITWEDKIQARNVMLTNYDRRLSEDLPTDLYNTVANYKQYLRDFPVTFGAAWNLTFTDAGAGYSVGDRLLISDPAYKNGTPAADILVTVTAVDANGAITGFEKTASYPYDYHPAAGTYNNVFYTSNSSGTGAVIQLSKVKTVDPWKITPEEPPLG